MKMEKRKFRIGELAEHLALERFVIRFWEKEFGIHGERSDGGQRFYDEKDLQRFATIKELLYDKGFTIAGAKKVLKKDGIKSSKESSDIIASHITTMEPNITFKPDHELSPDLAEQILELQRKLLKLRELL